MNRRSFFRSLAKAAAIVALAPQLAFRPKPIADWRIDAGAYWMQEERVSEWYSTEYLAAMQAMLKFPPGFYDFLMTQKPTCESPSPSGPTS